MGCAGQRGLTAGAPPGPGKQTPPLEGIHRYSEQKPRLHRNLSQTYLLVLEGLLRRQRVAVMYPWDMDTDGGDVRKCSSAYALMEADILLGSVDLAPPNSL